MGRNFGTSINDVISQMNKPEPVGVPYFNLK